MFKDMCQYLQLSKIPIDDLVGVAPGVFRGKVENNDMWFGLLSRARDLRNSPLFGRMHIQRDLTYRQRGEVVARRAAVAADRQWAPGAPVVATLWEAEDGLSVPPVALTGAYTTVMPAGGRGRGLGSGGRGSGGGRGFGVGRGSGGRDGGGSVDRSRTAFPPLHNIRHQRRHDLNY